MKEKLFELADKDYQSFIKNLVPQQEESHIIGIRMPQLRKFVKTLSEQERNDFLDQLPHSFYEENVLHSLLINEIKDIDEILFRLNEFAPYMDSWAVVDALKPVALKIDLEKTKKEIKTWLKSTHEYTVRMAILLLMMFYLDDPDSREWVVNVKHEGYYVRMIQAWFMCDGFVHDFDRSLPYLLDKRLGVWTHNKTIQKCVESFRISDEKKAYLKTLRRSKND